jgi:hypothetical protein
MKNKFCLSEQDLILHYYEERPTSSKEASHLAECSVCKERLASLSKDLSALPDLTQDVDSLAGTRMAARVTEQLNQPRRSWIPAIGASAIATCALVVSVAVWSPQQELEQTANLAISPLTANLNEEMSDIDFLEDFELLKELELLSQIEGV